MLSHEIKMETQTTELDVEKFRLAINNCAEFLAPYFRVSREQLRTFLFPSLKITKDDFPYFNPNTNSMEFRLLDYERPEVIGHETSHWIHYWANPSAWVGYPSKLEKQLIEGVALYGELTYFSKGKILEKPRISLPVLFRKSYSDIFYNRLSQAKLKLLLKDLNQISIKLGLGDKISNPSLQKHF